MASTTVRFQADADLTLTAYLTATGGTGTPAASYSATQVVKGWYAITVTEALVGKFLIHVLDASTNLVANGLLDLLDDTDTYYSFDPVGNRGFPDTSDTADGSDFTSIPWNSAWDAEVESECNDALVAYDAATGADIGANGANLSAIPWNAAWDAEVQSECVDALIAYDAATGSDIGANGANLSAIPWNAAWDAEVESEVNDALVAYDAATGADIQTVIDEVNEIGVGTGAISDTADSFVKTLGGVETGSVASTFELGGTYHIVPSDGNNDIDFYYEFDLGTYGVPVEVSWTGYATSQNETYRIYLYNWSTAAWEQVGTISGSNSTTNRNRVFLATTAHVGSGANVGKVRFRVESTTCTNFATDRILCEYIVVLPQDGSTYTAIPWNAAWDAEVQSEVTDALGGYDGSSFTAVPWNAAWDAEVQSEVADALTAYDTATEANVTLAKDQATIAALNVQK